MNAPPQEAPAGARPTDGITHRRSPYGVDETVERLTRAIHRAGAKLFCLVDHSGEAEHAGLVLRDTKLLVFGSPVGGTPAMVASPLSALDLPLKVLVWRDDSAVTWMSYLAPGWLAARHGLASEVAAPLSATDALTGQVAAG
ncbi:DUF302 domain-containing protein [Kitasatospora sp. HPMI-4]|uniref:DUF302 domain-containing protein n=1 Tax=Kitasatospora sp. HPMI-4 TaxID=3448443 RepID=UPI003F1A0D84